MQTTNRIDHGHVLAAAADAEIVVAEDIARRLAITQDDVQPLIDDLVAAGIIERDRVFS